MTKSKILTLVIPVLFTLLIAAGMADDSAPLIEVQSMVDTSVITIGDLINYSIIIQHDKGLRIKRPGGGLNLGNFEIKNYKFRDPVEKNGHITERFDFTISVFDTGHYTIPAFPVAYFPDTSKAYKIIEAAPIDIFVKSLLSGDKSPELKDVKAPIDIPFDWMFVWSIAGIVLMLAFAAFLGYKFWKQKKEKGYIFSPPPKPRPAHEVALEALNELYASDLLEKKEFKMFYSRLSDILRVYIEGRYFIQAMEETSMEIVAALREHLNDEQLESINGILTHSDLVKFAKYVPMDNETASIKNQSEQFIHDTKIILIPETQPQEDPQMALSAGKEVAIETEVKEE